MNWKVRLARFVLPPSSIQKLRPDIFLICIFLLLIFYKIRIMSPAAIGPRLELAIPKHDAAIASVMVLLYGMSLWSGRFEGRIGVTLVSLYRLGVVVLLIIFAADVCVYYFFATRLYLSDLITFSSELGAVESILRTAARIIRDLGIVRILILGALLFFVISTSLRYLTQARVASRSGPLVAGVVALALAGLWMVPLPEDAFAYGDKPLYENVLERNKDFIVRNHYSEQFIERLRLMEKPQLICAKGESRHLDVVVIIVESLSAYHSFEFSGIENWTPRLDEIARNEIALTNFYANGWTTIGGLLSLLGSKFPLVPDHAVANEWGSPRLSDFANLRNPIARHLAALGYSTTFVAGGDTGFLGQADWLRSMGFEKIVTDPDPRYFAERVRGPFDSIPDRLLFKIAIDEIYSAKRPSFTVVQTFWSHRPFMSPDGGPVHGEEQVIREADAQIGWLYDQLKAKRFFEHGLLFITGDHRAMEPFRSGEIECFGATARSRVPGVVVASGLSSPRRIEADFQQRDLAPSLLSIIDSTYCRDAIQGSFLTSSPVAPRCVLHSRGDDRDLIMVKCGHDIGTVRLSGDRTRFVEGGVTKPEEVIDAINRSRLGLD